MSYIKLNVKNYFPWTDYFLFKISLVEDFHILEYPFILCMSEIDQMCIKPSRNSDGNRGPQSPTFLT